MNFPSPFVQFRNIASNLSCLLGDNILLRPWYPIILFLSFANVTLHQVGMSPGFFTRYYHVQN